MALTVDHVLAVVAVSEVETSAAWYERLFGVEPTNIPMPGILVEWRVTGNGWVQVTEDRERFGSSQLNLAVDDLDEKLREIEARGIIVGDIIEANKGVRLCSLYDPDGNVVTLIGGFRERY
ncbi:VOC family protein [Leifsonia poae]|uniref:Glyoxalase n=1 Tax=Leifsonia poae TaxID=110933 RepID=A0A9W6HB64_9MICO|nr:VOC family protein [Leifsonia poae]GLJ77314.1 glyoxalase [Leifsonia poae]